MGGKKKLKTSILDGGFIRVSEACKLLSVSDDLIYKLMAAGQLESTWLGDCRLILRSSLEELLARRKK